MDIKYIHQTHDNFVLILITLGTLYHIGMTPEAAAASCIPFVDQFTVLCGTN